MFLRLPYTGVFYCSKISVVISRIKVWENASGIFVTPTQVYSTVSDLSSYHILSQMSEANCRIKDLLNIFLRLC